MPRMTALEALERFRRDGAWSRQVLHALTKQNKLDARDSALAGRLFYGTLQNLYLLDFYIDAYTKGKLEPKVRDVLRLGVYQILFMDRIPLSAAVSQSVILCRKMGYDRAAGLVNAVLRKICDERDALPEVPDAGTPEHLSIRYSHPQWLVEELIAQRGYGRAEAVLQSDNETTPVYIQVNTLKTTTEELGHTLVAEPYESVPDCLVLTRDRDFFTASAFQQGLFYVQDPAARMAVALAEPRPGMKVLDACAAPGGKTFAAAIAMGDEGHVDAMDINGAKLNLVMDGADRMGLDIISCIEGDAREISGGDYDLVFADVPCSGLGVIRKKPDIRYRDKAELDQLPDMQLELLSAISEAVKPGGRLMYSTCTWRAKENEEVVDAFLHSHPQFRKDMERTFWPDTDGADGFYICRMQRRE